jgi:hypothetical protein
MFFTECTFENKERWGLLLLNGSMYQIKLTKNTEATSVS